MKKFLLNPKLIALVVAVLMGFAGGIYTEKDIPTILQQIGSVLISSSVQ